MRMSDIYTNNFCRFKMRKLEVVATQDLVNLKHENDAAAESDRDAAICTSVRVCQCLDLRVIVRELYNKI